MTSDGIKFKKELEELKSMEVFVGFQAGENMEEDKDSGKQVDMVQIATWNELGTRTSPPRPFLRGSVDDNRDKINSTTASLLQRFIKGDTAESVLKKLGAFAVGLVRKKILDGPWIPNAPSTIKKKKSDRPLIDTGRMRQSVHYVIRKKGS